MTAYNNQNITSTTTEQEINITPPFDELDGTQVVRIEIVSGSVQFGVGPTSIPSDARAYTSGEKALFSIQNNIFPLRCKGSGVFTITY